MKLETIINFAYNYSNMWHFQFNVKKCAVLTYAKDDTSANIHYKLGESEIESKKSYNHLGVINYVKHSLSRSSIKSNVNKFKFSLYSMLGCSIRKTSLTPKCISKLYWSVSIPKLLSGCEVRYFSGAELDEYEKVHRGIAKQVQLLPDRTPDHVCLATMGWLKLQSYIEKLYHC